ncbi:hypothetical protein WA026_010793 [Henosepilachna vigintioctopunctata]|uniref:Uncharacterized protein n=1 Tax=Henosepilachna vigintioctopunctata TaxID=420089 RepID=A0AAW1V0E2_9CUCU
MQQFGRKRLAQAKIDRRKGAGKELHSPAKVQPCVPSRQPNCSLGSMNFVAPLSAFLSGLRVSPLAPQNIRPKPTCEFTICDRHALFHQGYAYCTQI